MSTPITAQMIFNAAWQKFIVEQAPPAVRHTPDDVDGILYHCCYLTDDGKKCAVGLCLPDGHKFQKSDMAFTNLLRHEPELFNIKPGEDTLQELLHDTLLDQDTGQWKYSPEEMKSHYLYAAKQFNLTVPQEN